MSADEHGNGIPDEAIVIGFTGLMVGLTVVASGLALLVGLWMTQATPDMRVVEPPPVVEAHH